MKTPTTIVVTARKISNPKIVRSIVSRLSERYFGVAPSFTGKGRSLTASICPSSKYRLKTINVLEMETALSSYLGDDATVSVMNATFTVSPNGGEFHIAW